MHFGYKVYLGCLEESLCDYLKGNRIKSMKKVILQNLFHREAFSSTCQN